jgi:1A family penicillin-binding protein
MKHNNEKSRSYGYVGDNPQKKQEPKPQFTKKRELSKQKIKKINFTKLFLFPFVVLKIIISFFFRIIFKGKNTTSIFKKLFLWGTILSVLGMLALGIYALFLSRTLPDPDKLQDRPVAESTKIYDKTGEHLLYEIYADQKRTLIDYDQIPQDVINAAIATEDTKFYEHMGIRPLSILRSFIMAPIRGRVAGTSTLTQQLVKNAILTSERSIIRKIKELILSVQLERKYSKKQILKIYFNEISYGSTNYGLESAAQSYFGKPAKELALHESAALAGMVKQPTSYLNDHEFFKQRRDFVLFRMHAEGYITEEEKNNAQKEPLEIKQKIENIQAPHFVFYVKQQLVERYGEQRVDTEGLKVYTTLDWDMQQAAEDAIKEQSEKYFEEAQADNASLVAINPKNGQVLAMVGSRDFFNKDISGQFNVATLGKRQPGSSFKPIIYTAAFEKGFTPETIVFDVKTNFSVSETKDYTPLNYDLSEHGPVTLRKALQGSLNIPAVKAMYLVGEKSSIDFAKRLGYTTLGEGDFGLSLVLGGGEVKLIEHVSAYTTFANGGLKFPTKSLLRVEDKHGKIIDEWKDEKGERVLESKIAATIANTLSDDNARAYAFGTDGILTIPEHTVAAKTGTTNGYVDAWTVGFTPNIAAGVWAGNTDNTPMKRGYGGSRVAGPIWNQFMKNALKTLPKESFPEPPPNEETKSILRGSTEGGVPVKINKITGKLAASSTPENLIIERIFIPQHSILHYVDKNDPPGPLPEDPTVDSQYTIWENSIADWVTRKQEEDPDFKLSTKEPPTEYDDEYSLALLPSLEVVYPTPSSTIQTRQLDTDIRVSAPRGVSRVLYYIDNKLISTETTHPYNLNFYLREQTPGKHTLKIAVEDDIGNRVEQEVNFILETNNQKAHAFWWKNNKTKLNTNEFPAILFLELYKQEDIKKITIKAQKESDTIILEPIENFDSLLNGLATTRWSQEPEAGVWTIIADSYDHDGLKTLTDKTTINIINN